MQNFLKQPISRRSVQLFTILILIDLVFMLLHVLYRQTSLLPDIRFSITRDKGFAEVYQYLKLLGIIFCMGLLFIRNRSLVYLGWLCIFLLVLVDDALQIHEQWGKSLGEFFGFQHRFGLRPQDFGESSVFCAYALLILAIVIISYRKERNSSHKLASAGLFLLLLLLMFFSVAMDMSHMVVVTLSPDQIKVSLDLIFEILEDGGELIVGSLVAGFSYLLVNPKPQLSAVQRSAVLSSR